MVMVPPFWAEKDSEDYIKGSLDYARDDILEIVCELTEYSKMRVRSLHALRLVEMTIGG